MNKRDYEDDEASCSDMETDSETTLGESMDDFINDEPGPIETEKGKEKEKEKEIPLPPKKRKRVDEEPKEKPKKFNLHARQLFLTYPQCPITREDAYGQLVDKIGTPTEYIVAQESVSITFITAKDCLDQLIQYEMCLQ